MRIMALLLVGALVIVGCSDDEGDVASLETTTTTTAAETTTTTTTTATDGAVDPVGEPACPAAEPIPSGAEELMTAPVSFDGDGDGLDDTLSTYLHEDAWWVHVEWGSGGSAAVAVDDVSMAMGIRPLGGYELGDQGYDVAFVSMGGPASGSVIGLFVARDCELAPVMDTDTAGPFTFTVTASIGTFSGATCAGLGDIDLFLGELVDADAGEYMVAQAPYAYDGGQVSAGFGDAGSVDLDDVADFSSLDCGELRGVQ